mmetsp:Transcript_35371/g.92518  ORF Transcript_35371/g.92518 Transcript_35371/m.92518 type:complete len:205 (-) Transcript_35371:185-799(-)
MSSDSACSSGSCRGASGTATAATPLASAPVVLAAIGAATRAPSSSGVAIGVSASPPAASTEAVAASGAGAAATSAAFSLSAWAAPAAHTKGHCLACALCSSRGSSSGSHPARCLLHVKQRTMSRASELGQCTKPAAAKSFALAVYALCGQNLKVLSREASMSRFTNAQLAECFTCSRIGLSSGSQPSRSFPHMKQLTLSSGPTW